MSAVQTPFQSFVSTYRFTKWQRVYIKMKRVGDFLLALFLLVALSPLMLTSLIWVRCESKGSAIFKQRRPGYHQNIFTMYKFRSMRPEILSETGRPLTNEERLTRSGRFLRKTSIDELPQLINILRGEMSFIGPRPFLINDLGSYNIEQLIRFEVLPGITSWTAIHGRASVTIQEKYDYEIFYVKHIGFKADAEIFFKTIFLILEQSDVEDIHANRVGAEIVEDISDLRDGAG